MVLTQRVSQQRGTVSALVVTEVELLGAGSKAAVGNVAVLRAVPPIMVDRLGAPVASHHLTSCAAPLLIGPDKQEYH